MQRVLARRLLGLVPESKTGLERLIDKKRESYELQVDLDQKKQQHAIKMAQFRAKAEELERKNLENQEEVVSKDQYVCDNWNKRQREEERLQSEEKLLQTKQQELAHLVEEHDRLMEQKAEIEEQLKASLPYKDYLDSVFEAAPEMVSNGNISEVQGIVMKYKTLCEWRGTLQVRLMRSKQELTKLRDAMALYDESSTNACVEIDYQIKCIAQAEEDSFKDFGRQRHQQETQANQNRAKAEEAAVIRLAIDNMYQKVKKGLLSKFRRRDGDATKLIEKFNFIKNQIWDMVEIEEQTRNCSGHQSKADTRAGTPLKSRRK
ncbi:hypothetical protein TRFO_12128 [Tritrichomonas foetus]|uniref:DUF4200 domain-containing protein n=1 Tax=Tritrichomonas foetus TaxID=1144522 RepID=A0A1J4J669_9EUKA|nr:hypothetical protein TRFO_12128 [Tritrichomonas foetus]|eukprot:OHS92949.1 hypothetical protein TRFO_12128 [Tritrichomonas foetus]